MKTEKLKQLIFFLFFPIFEILLKKNKLFLSNVKNEKLSNIFRRGNKKTHTHIRTRRNLLHLLFNKYDFCMLKLNGSCFKDETKFSQ